MVTFNVTDRETGEPLEGILIWEEYTTIYKFPIIGGFCDVVSSGTFKGARKVFTVRVPGYVDHSYFFFQHNSPTFDIALSKFWWFEEAEPTPPVEEKGSITPLLVLGAVGLVLSG